MPSIDDEPSGIEYLKKLKAEPVGAILKYARDYELMQSKPLEIQKIVDSVQKSRSEFTKLHPEYSEDEINLYFHMIFGMLALDPNKYSGERVGTAEKVESARTQQMMVHKMLWGIYGEKADKGAQEKIYHQWRNLELLARTQMGRKVGLEIILSGIRSQASIIQALMDEDFRVILPNYVSQANGYSQVQDWDVSRGIDFLAVPPENDRLWLLNAKGSSISEAVEILNRTRQNVIKELPKDILAYAPNDIPIIQAEIRVPSRSQHRVVQELPETVSNYQYGLSNALLLKEVSYADIIDQLRGLQ